MEALMDGGVGRRGLLKRLLGGVSGARAAAMACLAAPSEGVAAPEEEPFQSRKRPPYQNALHVLPADAALGLPQLPVFLPEGGEALTSLLLPGPGGVLDLAVDQDSGKLWALYHERGRTRLEEHFQAEIGLWVLPGTLYARSGIFKRGRRVALLAEDDPVGYGDTGALTEVSFTQRGGLPEMETRVLRSSSSGYLEYDRHLIGSKGKRLLYALDKAGARLNDRYSPTDNSLELPLAARSLENQPWQFSAEGDRLAWLDLSGLLVVARRVGEGWLRVEREFKAAELGWDAKQIKASCLALTGLGVAVGFTAEGKSADRIPRVVWLREEGTKLTVERVAKGLLARPMLRW